MFYTAVSRLLRRAWGGTPFFDDRKPDEVNPQVLMSQAKHTASMLQQFIEELAALSANSESYESLVPVKITANGEDKSPPDRTIINQGGTNIDVQLNVNNLEQNFSPGDSYYALEVSNPGSYAVNNSNGDTVVKNGFAMNAFGVCNFQAAPRRNFHVDDGDTFVNYAILVDNIMVNVKLQVNNRINIGVDGSVYMGDTLVYENNVWYGGGIEGKVKLTTPADTAKYLQNHFINLTTHAYDATYDIPIKAVVEAGQLRLFIDSSSFTDWSQGQNQGLMHASGAGWKAVEFGTCS